MRKEISHLSPVCLLLPVAADAAAATPSAHVRTLHTPVPMHVEGVASSRGPNAPPLGADAARVVRDMPVESSPSTSAPASSTQPPPPPSQSSGFVIGDPDQPFPPSPFVSTDPNVPTVYGDAHRDGVDREDPYCKWIDGKKMCA